MRTLSTFNFSVGTVQDEFGNRRIGYAAKLGVYKEKDPLLVKDIYDDIEADIQAERDDLEIQLKDAKNHLDTLRNILQKPAARTKITDLDTAGKSLALAIARLFPESFHVWGERISVRDEAGTEASRAMVRENLEQLHERDQQSGKKQRKNKGQRNKKAMKVQSERK